MSLHEHTRDFVGRCLLEQEAYSTLEKLCVEVGSRLSGSEEERRALARYLGRLSSTQR